MSRTKRKPTKSSYGLIVNLCSLCNEITLTVGQQHHGGIRYCRACIQETFAWFQMSVDDRSSLLTTFDKAMSRPDIQLVLQAVSAMSPEWKKAQSISESKWRLMDAYRSET